MRAYSRAHWSVGRRSKSNVGPISGTRYVYRPQTSIGFAANQASIHVLETHMQKPRPLPAGALVTKFDRRLYPSRREPVVDAATENVVGRFGGHVCSERKSSGGWQNDRIADRAEVHIQVFDLGAPVGGEPPLNASPYRPTKAVGTSRPAKADRSAIRRKRS